MSYLIDFVIKTLSNDHEDIVISKSCDSNNDSRKGSKCFGTIHNNDDLGYRTTNPNTLDLSKCRKLSGH
eukprot:Pgem_evm1s20022